jgi:signal transduction histidine kinase/CheY-like chemotaxis protein
MMESMVLFDSKLESSFRKHDYYKEFFSEMKIHLKSIRNTNSFMMMSINRCMDYSKASRGFKLTPHLDSINFLQTLSLPLNCMKNIQDRVHISLFPVSHEICSFIITDKQWLQENILCLLSNAVKYSTSGTVSIKLYLQESDELLNDPLELFTVTTTKHYKKSPKSLHSLGMHSTHSTIRNSNSTRKLHYNDVHSKPIDNTTASTSVDTATSLTPNKYLLFEIEDTGIGMDDETMKALFSPFKQAQRLAGGTGLGLYSLSKRVEALEGKYGVSQRRDGREGSLFWFTIPYRPDYTLSSAHVNDESSITIHASEKRMIRSSVPVGSRSRNSSGCSADDSSYLSKYESSVRSKYESSIRSKFSPPKLTSIRVQPVVSYNILLVEDSPTISKMTCLMLKRLGHKVDLAENGHRGLNKMISSFEAVVAAAVTGSSDGRNYHVSLMNEEKSVTSIEQRTAAMKIQKYDIILMDFQMPIMDGLEATKRYREYERKKLSSLSSDDDSLSHQQQLFYHLRKDNKQRLLIIGLSATCDKETIDEGINVGLDDILFKPINAEVFHEKINHFF